MKYYNFELEFAIGFPDNFPKEQSKEIIHAVEYAFVNSSVVMLPANVQLYFISKQGLINELT